MTAPGWSEAGDVLTGFASGGGRDVTVLVAPGLPAEAVGDVVDRIRAASGLTPRVEVCDDVGVGALRRTSGRRLCATVALGGGTVVDHAALVSVAAEHAEVVPRLTAHQRCGMVVLPPTLARRAPFVAIPTTVGTGAEASAVACVEVAGRKRLVVGRQLRPDAYVHDPRLTAGLPASLVLDGAFESLMRAVGPYLGDDDARPTQDALALALAQACLRYAEAAHAAVQAGTAPDERLRLAVASAAAAGHAVALRRDDRPFAVKQWFVAHEVGHVTGVRKAGALALVVPRIWARVEAGDERWGSPARLARLWAHLAPDATHGPADGLADAVRRWGLVPSCALDDDAVDALTSQVVHAWGAGLPMLAPLGRDDVRGLLREALPQPRRTEALLRT